MTFELAQIGELIRHTRKAIGLTQEKLAMAAGVGLRFIVDMERGKPTCQLGKAVIVLNTLGITVTLAAPAREQDSN